jgi:hypothetical protein
MDEEGIQPAGGAGAAAPEPALASLNEENLSRKARTLEYKTKVDELRETITSKPVFLIATHGEYTPANTEAPVEVPNGALIVELASIGEIASCNLGAYGDSFRSMLTPDRLPEILTAERGKTVRNINELSLHMSAKYMGGMYYQRYLTLSPTDKLPNFFVQKIYNGETLELEYIEGILHKKWRKHQGMNLNRIINIIFERDPDAYELGGVFIIATCGAVNSDKISDETISRITAYHEAHRTLVDRTPSRFRFQTRVTLKEAKPRAPMKSTRKKPKSGLPLLIYEQTDPVTIIKNGIPKEIKVGLHSRMTRKVGNNTNVKNRYIAPSEDSYMIKVGPAIYHKHGKVIFSNLEMRRILQQLEDRVRRMEELPDIEVYNGTTRKWAKVYVA